MPEHTNLKRTDNRVKYVRLAILAAETSCNISQAQTSSMVIGLAAVSILRILLKQMS